MTPAGAIERDLIENFAGAWPGSPFIPGRSPEREGFAEHAADELCPDRLGHLQHAPQVLLQLYPSLVLFSLLSTRHLSLV